MCLLIFAMNEKDLEKYENGRIIASILENKSKSYYLPLVQEKQLSKNVNTENIVQSLKETIKKLTDEKENLEEFLDSIDNENKTKLTKEEKDKMQKVCGDLTKKDNSLKKLKRLLGCFSDKVPDYYKFITLRWLVSDNGVKNDEKKNNEKDEVETLERDALILALSKFLKPEYVVNKTTEKNDKQKHLLCFLKDYHKDVASDFNDGSKIDLQYYAPNGIVLSNNDGEKKYILNSNGILFPASLSSVLEKNNALSDNNVKDKDKNAETDKKKVDNFVKGVKNMNEDEIKALIKQERAEHDIENLKLNNLVNDRMMQYMAQAMSFIPLLYNNQQMQNRFSNGYRGIPNVPMFNPMMPPIMPPIFPYQRPPRMSPNNFNVNNGIDKVAQVELANKDKRINNDKPEQIKKTSNVSNTI